MNYSQTLSHQQHLKENRMSDYEKQQALKKIEQDKQDALDRMNGVTSKVKSLKYKIQVADGRTNQSTVNDGYAKFNPRDARRLSELAKVRAGLMEDSTNYFGTLDHAVVRKSYEFESLNKRQQNAILAQFKWIYEEMEQEELPTIAKDEWYYPLQVEYEKLSEKEQANFEPMEHMTMVSYEELQGADIQPVWAVTSTHATQNGGTETGVGAESVMSATE